MLSTMLLAVLLAEPPQAPPVNTPPQAPVVTTSLAKKTAGCDCKICVCDRCECGSYKVLDFFTKTCVPCARFRPVLDAWAVKFKARGIFQAIDAERDSQLAAHYGVHAYPTVIVLKDNKVVATFVGAPSEDQIQNALGLKTKVTYAEALQMATAGKTFMLAVGVEPKSLTEFGNLPVYECTDPPAGPVRGHYRCQLGATGAEWVAPATAPKSVTQSPPLSYQLAPRFLSRAGCTTSG